MRLVALELFKLRTQRAMLILLLAAVLLSLFGFVVLAIVIRLNAAEGVHLATETMQRQLLGTGGGTTLILVFAVVGITGEYRHRTISSTFLATPERHQVLIAKLVAYMIVAMLYGVIVACIATAGVLALLSIENVPLIVPWDEIFKDYGRDLIALALYAGFGFGIGAVVANQIAGIVIVLVEPVVSSIVGALVPTVGRFLPSQAAGAFQSEQEFFFSEMLSRGAGGLVFLGWAACLVATAAYMTHQRDIT